MLTLEVINNELFINGTPVSFPAAINDLHNIIGESKHAAAKYNHVYTWDNEGLVAYSRDGNMVESLFATLKKSDVRYMPTNAFAGKFTIDGTDITSYYAANKKKRIKLFQGDDGGAFIFGGLQTWFDLKDKEIEGIEIKAHELPEIYEKLEPDPEFAHYKELWEKWIAAVNAIVPEDNRYYNLADGIAANEIEDIPADEDFSIPPALLDFYKVHDVAYDAVASPFSFTRINNQFDLIPFADIHSHWQGIQDLQDGDPDPALTKGYSIKLKADNYANPKWIPFAENREGDYLLFDTDPAESGTYGQIVELQNESWSREVIAASLEALVKDQVDILAKGSNKYFEFMVEKG